MTKRSLRDGFTVRIFVTGFLQILFFPRSRIPGIGERFVPTCVESIVSRKTITRSSSRKCQAREATLGSDEEPFHLTRIIRGGDNYNFGTVFQRKV